MNFVQQKYKNSCGVACLAMWLGQSHEEVEVQHFPTPFFDFNKDQLSVESLVGVLQSRCIHAVAHPTWLIREPGILFVPSLNVQGSGHFIYYGGPGILFDPNEGRDVLTYTLATVFRPFCHIVDVSSKNAWARVLSHAEFLMDTLNKVGHVKD